MCSSLLPGDAQVDGSQESHTHQPAQVPEADVELMPPANLLAMGAMDVICRDRQHRSFLGSVQLLRGIPGCAGYPHRLSQK